MNDELRFKPARLIVRSPVIDDAQVIFDTYAQDPEVTRYLVWKPHIKYEQTLEWINHCIQTRNDDSGIKLVIYHKADKAAIGMIDFRFDDFKSDFGYVLARKYWKNGLMTEAMKPVMEHVYSKPTIYRIWASHDIDNDASGRVMLKLGMQFEGILRRAFLHPNISDKPRDGKVYSLVKD